MNKNLEFGQKLHEIVEFYQSLDFKKQKLLLRAMTIHTKQPPFSITFEMDPTGIAKMAQVISYCKKYEIPYKPEKRGSKKVAFSFENLSDRNTVLLGRLTI